MSQILYVSLQDDERILSFDIDERSGLLEPRPPVAVPGGPGPLALHPGGRFLYAGLRGKAGLAWLKRDPATGDLSRGGEIALEADPAYISTDRSGRFLFSAYYRAGLVGVHPLLADGSIATPAVEWRPTAVNAHFMQADPANRFAFVPHTGPNLILQFRFDAAAGRLSPNEPPAADPPASVGPRHFCFHPNGRLALFSNEHASSMSAYRYDPQTGTMRHAHTVSTLPAGFSGESTCAQIHLGADGRFVYVSNRGHDSIATVAVDAQSGELRFVGTAASQRVPRAFNLDLQGRFLYAAGQESGKLAAYRVGGDGLLAPLSVIELGRKPMWVVASATGDGPARGGGGGRREG